MSERATAFFVFGFLFFYAALFVGAEWIDHVDRNYYGIIMHIWIATAILRFSK